MANGIHYGTNAWLQNHLPGSIEKTNCHHQPFILKPSQTCRRQPTQSEQTTMNHTYFEQLEKARIYEQGWFGSHHNLPPVPLFFCAHCLQPQPYGSLFCWTSQDHCQAAYLYRGTNSEQTLTARLMNKLAVDTIPGDDTKKNAATTTPPTQEQQAIRNITEGQVLHSLDTGVSKLSTDPRKYLCDS